MLGNVKKPRIRNLVRGALSAANSNELENTLKSIRREASPQDAYNAYKYMYYGPLSSSFATPDPFPDHPSATNANTYFGSTSLIHQLTYERVRFEHHSEKLANAVSDLMAVNKSIFDENTVDLAVSLRNLKKNYGCSLVLLKKLVSIKNLNFHDVDLDVVVQELLRDFVQPTRSLPAAAFEDSVDLDREYIESRKNFISYINRNYLSDRDAVILTDYFNPCFSSSIEASNRLQANGCFSVLDALVFLLNNDVQLERCCSGEEYEFYKHSIPMVITKKWAETLPAFPVNVFSSLLISEDRYKEYSLFRHSANFLEFPSVFFYRRNIECLIGDRLGLVDSYKVPTCDIEPIDIEQSDLTTVAQSKCVTPLDITKIVPVKCGNFHRSVYLVWRIKQGGAPSHINGMELLRLLDITMDVASLTNPEEINGFFLRDDGDLLHSYLCYALINDSLNSGVSEHLLRKVLQKLIIQEYDRDIVKFADFLFHNAKHVAQHFMYLCTESFLTKLYDLYDAAEEVQNARADLLKWFGERFEDQAAIERSNSLQLALKLQKVRDDVDDNRIYVDPIRFGGWVTENVSNDLRDLGTVLPLPGYKQGFLLSDNLQNPVRVLEQPRLKLPAIIDKCYSEFCSNKNYGVEAYVGRRIRHGSLGGMMLSDITPLVKEAFESFGEDTEVSRKIAEWFSSYKKIVKYIGQELLRVNSKANPDGAIRPTIVSKNKKANADWAIEKVSKSILEEGSSIASEYIYEFCWFFLEADLKEIRKDLSDIRTKKLILSPNAIYRGSDHHMVDNVNRFTSRINSLVERKFEKLCSWMRKPNNISPSTSLPLLFRAILLEVQEHHREFEPDVSMLGTDDIMLQGHKYHVFYDILKDLVTNAAVHSLPRGKLIFSVIPSSQRSNEATLSVESEIKEEQSDEVRKKIDGAMTAELSDVMIAVKNSGIKKIRETIKNTEETRDLSYHIEGTKVIAKFIMDIQRA